MDKYSRWFIVASVMYLLIGAFMGVMMATGLLDLSFRFVHIHLNLFGFMTMMVFGVAYHILPRFMGKMVKNAGLIPLHFYFVNIGLIGMMLSYLGGGYMEQSSLTATYLFGVFSIISFVGIIFFALNIIPVMMLTRVKPVSQVPGVKTETTKPVAPVKNELIITGEMKIGEILEKKPETLKAFIQAGFKGFENPEKRKAFGDKLVLKTACQIRSIDLNDLLAKLNGPISDDASSVAEVQLPVKPAKELSIKRGDLITLDTPVGDMVQVYPETKIVLENNYGGECFSCPGMAVETIKETANMHNKKPGDVLGQINSIVKKLVDK